MRFGLRLKILIIAASVTLLGMGVVLTATTYLFSGAYVASLQSRSLAVAQGLKIQIDRILQLGIRLDNLVGFEKQCQDVVATYDGPPRLDPTAPQDPITCSGRDNLVAAVSGLFVVARSIHQGYMPEIELTSPTTAKGIWSMWDYIRSPKGTFQGWGHYHEDYEELDRTCDICGKLLDSNDN